MFSSCLRSNLNLYWEKQQQYWTSRLILELCIPTQTFEVWTFLGCHITGQVEFLTTTVVKKSVKVKQGPACTVKERPLHKIILQRTIVRTHLTPGYFSAEFIFIMRDLESLKKWKCLATSNWKRKKAVAAKTFCCMKGNVAQVDWPYDAHALRKMDARIMSYTLLHNFTNSTLQPITISATRFKLRRSKSAQHLLLHLLDGFTSFVYLYFQVFYPYLFFIFCFFSSRRVDLLFSTLQCFISTPYFVYFCLGYIPLCQLVSPSLV